MGVPVCSPEFDWNQGLSPRRMSRILVSEQY